MFTLSGPPDVSSHRPEFGRLNKIAVPTSEGFTFIDLSNIYYLEANGSHTSIVFADRSKLDSNKSLGYFELELGDEPFLRIHHSLLINLNKVKSYVRGDEGYVIMQNGKPLTVSRSRKEEFLQFFKKRKDQLHLLCVPAVGEFFYVEIKYILFLQSRKNHAFGVEIFFDDKSVLESSKNIGFYEAELAGKAFFRVNNSAIINLDKVRSYIKGDSTYVVMRDGRNLEVSKSKKEDLLSILKGGKKNNY